jgi:hypothetical protein
MFDALLERERLLEDVIPGEVPWIVAVVLSQLTIPLAP